jgi:hypothetical protein
MDVGEISTQVGYVELTGQLSMDYWPVVRAVTLGDLANPGDSLIPRGRTRYVRNRFFD